MMFKAILTGMLGFLLGFATMAYLSMRASATFLELARVNYQIEQQILGVCAKRRGDMNKAVTHYTNGVAASSSQDMAFWKQAHTRWTFWFPVANLILERMQAAAENQRAFNLDESIRRALLADALERAGRFEEAQAEYTQAARLLGHKSIEQVKHLAETNAEMEGQLLTIKDPPYECSSD